MSTQIELLKSKRFLPFFVTQFLGAFNDNVFKNALVVLLAFHASQWTTLSEGVLTNLAAGLFMLPFFLFSAVAGQLADKYDKAWLAQRVKMLEIGIMVIAGFGFYMHSVTWLMTALFFMGVHSTIFGPIKYSILPQHLADKELLAGNALIEAGTFAAILLGTLLGSLLAETEVTWYITAACLVIAVLGLLSSLKVPKCPSVAPDTRVSLNIVTATYSNLKATAKNKPVFSAILAISWFWMYGALFLAQFPVYVKNVMGGTETSVTLLLTTFTVGIGLGSLLCDKLSHHRVKPAMVTIGGIGLALFGLDFAISTSHIVAQHGAAMRDLLHDTHVLKMLGDLLGLGFFGGLFCVPLYTRMQQDSDAKVRSQVIASNNIVNALFMVVGALVAGSLLSQGWGMAKLFGCAAGLHALAMVLLVVFNKEYRTLRLKG